ncbi:M20/M25/M40 family metallo-hydrolase [Pontibacillus salicampi]|uniref:M20/M25/M40 family metallo-hydrolase n=1 Tax=Pontibacillus salicampi TaxID=1449801 RepID=A0ABV6LQB8_9BACI
MYQNLKDLTLEQQLEQLTKELVSIPSVNGTTGEVTIADYLLQVLQSYPYFQRNPSHVWSQELPNDALGRKNVFAYVEGEADSTKTIVYHCHMDTVGVDDFGAWKLEANNPDKLLEQFSAYEYDHELQSEAKSGEWMFGRGALDMKSGIAVHLMNLLYFSDHVKELDGNILLTINPVEENEHTGIVAAVSELERLKQERELEYVVAFNSDFISPLYEGDQTRYVYTGAVGKLLPSFYIRGREAHVGQTLTGVDPTLISSELNRRINNNMELAEDIPGEIVLPPSCLLQRDQKDFYNVQTAGKSYLYFNYFIYRSTPKQVMDRLVQVAEEATRDIEERLKQNYKLYQSRTKLPMEKLDWHISVSTYSEYIKELEQKGVDTKAIAKEIVDTYRHHEPRELCFKVVDALQHYDTESTPRVIIFYAPPFCPHNYLDQQDVLQSKKLDVLNNVLQHYKQTTGESFAVKNFFPYLSDSSYLSLHDTDEDLHILQENFPEWDDIYPVPVKSIRELDIPSVNIGVYGKDAHQWTERLYKPYSFGVLPYVLRDMTQEMLQSFACVKSESSNLPN